MPLSANRRTNRCMSRVLLTLGTRELVAIQWSELCERNGDGRMTPTDPWAVKSQGVV